jgi:hypothetical protein
MFKMSESKANGNNNKTKENSQWFTEIKEWAFTHERSIRIIFYLTFAILTFLSLLAEFKIINSFTDWIGIENLNDEIDWGGVGSFLGFITTIIILKIDKYVWNEYKKVKTDKDPIKMLLILFFIVVGFFGLWFTIRYFGLMVKNSLLKQEPSFNYTTSLIFEMLGYILTVNLSFNLANTFSKKQIPPRELLYGLIQAIGIGLISLIPRYGDPLLLGIISSNNKYNSAINFVLLLVTLISALLILIWFRERFFPEAPTKLGNQKK